MLSRPQAIRFLLGLAMSMGGSLSAQPVRVGIDQDGEPMTFVDSKGVPTGFAVEIMNAIAREMKFEVEYVVKPWAGMLDDFTAGRTDALANITYTEQRATFMEFTAPHIVLNAALFVRKGDTSVKSPVDLRNIRVAVKPGGAPHQYLVAHGWADHIVPANTLRDSLRALVEGRADGALDARIIGLKNIRDDRLTNLTVADVQFLDFAQRLHIGFQPGNAARLALFNDGLARLHANGTYDKIYAKWIGPLEPHRVQFRELQPYLIPGALLLAFIIGALFWQRRLLLQLARQTDALRVSEERLTLVLEASESGSWDWDLRTGRVERSEHWASMFGYTLAEIPATLDGATPLVHPDDRAAYDAFIAQRRTGQNSRYDIEYRIKTKTGEWRWILDRGKAVVRAPDGKPLRMAGTHTDITDLKNAQEELSRKEAQFRFIYEKAPVGLSWVSGQQANTRLVNPAHERITGVPAAQSLNTENYVAASHRDDRERQNILIARLYRGEIDHFSMEKRYVHPNGRIVWASLTMHLFRDPATGKAQEVTTLVDITELKRAEEDREKLRLKMLETQKLESLGVLAGGIAHDFNNLLTVILGNASLARHEAAGDPAHDAALAHIEKASRRAADLCRQMLAYAGQGSFFLERIDLSRLVQDTTQLLRISISKKAQLTLNLATGLPRIEADASQLRQVVMNLVINASEALTDATAEIRIETRLDQPDPAYRGVIHSFDVPPGECVCLEVTDTGRGMNAATLARIFDPFFTTKFTGRGLGLAAVLGIVRAHHGALAVESQVGKGTTFRLYLPTAKTVDTAPTVATNPPIPVRGGAGTVLVADDEPIVLSTTDHLLRQNGYRTVLAGDGEEALRQFRTDPQQFAAVLLDLTMPRLDGAETLREMRLLNPNVRVLLMSGFSEQDVRNRLQDQGPVPILHKPFTRETLLSRLGELTRLG